MTPQLPWNSPYSADNSQNVLALNTMNKFQRHHILPATEVLTSIFLSRHHVAQQYEKEVEYPVEMGFPVPKQNVFITATNISSNIFLVFSF